MASLQIQVAPLVAQSFKVVLGEQACEIEIRERLGRLYMSLVADGVTAWTNYPCFDRQNIKPFRHMPFVGGLYFIDVEGYSDPVASGLGTRYFLVYFPTEDEFQGRVFDTEELSTFQSDSAILTAKEGLFDFSYDGPDVRWVFPDGTESTEAHPAVMLSTAGNVNLYSSSWDGEYSLSDRDTNENYVGALSNLPPLTYYLNLGNCLNVTGDLSSLPPVTYYLSLSNCPNVTGDLSSLPPVTYLLNLGNCLNVTGDLSSLPPVTYLLNLSNCLNVTGDLSSLPPLTYYLNLGNCLNVTGDLSSLPPVTYYLSLGNCLNVTGDLSSLPPVTYLLSLGNCSTVTGILPTTVTAYKIYLDRTGLSKADLEQSLINVDSMAGSPAPSGAIFDANSGMPTITDPSAIAAVNSLRTKGWTVSVNGA